MKTSLAIKSILFNFLTAGFLLFFLFSCAGTSVKPLSSGELRLKEMHIEGKEDIRDGFPVNIAIVFEADGKPDIQTICFYWGSEGPYFYKNMDINFEPPRTIRTEVIAHSSLSNTTSTVKVDGYVVYNRGGKNQPSNSVTTYVRVLSR